MSNDDEAGPAQYSSPPCFMHELDPAYRPPLSEWADVRRWRKAERERLIAARLATSAVNERGGRTALPIVVDKGQPLIFRAYRHGDRLDRGVWNIPIPAEGDPVLPDVVISPIVGIDPDNYRLGYGGGFFDRTLASLPRKPLVIGVGYELQRIVTIYPQPHDIPMDMVVTETKAAGPA